MDTQRQSTNNLDIRQLNIDAVYWFIYNAGAVSTKDITQGLNLSLPTVTHHLRLLMQRQLIASTGMMDSTGGRKARAYTVDGENHLTLGLDITRRGLSMTAINLKGQAAFQMHYALPFRDEPLYYDQLGNLVRQSLEGNGVPLQNVLGAGISLPAILSADGEVAINASPLGVMQLERSRFSRCLPFPCTLHNDANAGGYAAVWAMDSSHEHEGKSIVYLSVSDTVGGSIMIDGKIYPGMQQHSAEFGHMTLIPDGEPCYCGQRGCSYAYINTRRLSDAAGGRLNQFFEGLQMGVPAMKALWEEYLDKLVLTINNIHSALDCDVIIGGYLGRYIGPYVADLRARLARRNMFDKTGDYVLTCTGIEDISAVGAALIHQFGGIKRLLGGQ